jgi:cell division protein FtsQ
MDDRGRLAQSLISIPARTLLDAAASRLTRVQRLFRRLLSPLYELNPPRGIGALAAGMLLAGTSAYGVVRGGHLDALADELHNVCDQVANRAGFGISTISLRGGTQWSRDDLLARAGLTRGSSLLCLDAAAARAKLKTDPWIADATVLKLYPGRLQIEITPRAALALWQNDGEVNVIAGDGTVLELFTGARYVELPLVVGQGAQAKARDFLALIDSYPVLRDSVEASVRVADRRWNLRLKSGIDVRLPENDVEAALQTLVRLDRDKKLLSRDITAVDLRLADRVTVRLSDGAAQAREAAVKDMMKKQKARKKGSEA